jgi:hypothetical protein
LAKFANQSSDHSRQDDEIPFAELEKLVSKSGLQPETPIEVGIDHWLAATEPLKAMLKACGLIYERKL